MFENRISQSAIRGCMVAVWLAVLAGCGGSGSGPDSSGIPTPTGAPAVPASLTATAGDAQVALAWTASSGATSYHVKRSTTNGGPFTQVSAPTSASYTDPSLTNGTTYYYVVSAVGTGGESANSTQASAAPASASSPPGATVPAVPASVVATAGDSIVNLTWAASSGATSYHVKRGTTVGGPYAKVGAPTSGSYSDTSVTNGMTYFYVVTALNSAGESAASAQVSAGPAASSSNPPPTSFGTWTNVTPSGVDLVNGSCGNYGVETMQVDHAHPSNLYFEAHCQGIWKSTDYGATWTGPINTGTNGATVTDCAGGLTIWPNSTATTPTIYVACIRGSGLGFWKSTDGGVNWTQYNIAPSGSRQDFYPPVVDPYDGNHLLMAGHEMNYIVESVDGGQTWANVTMDNGMLQSGGTGEIFFIDTGNATTTRTTWLWQAQITGGNIGTWRTETGGSVPTWTRVDKNEHPHGASQIYQPDSHGVVYMAGLYSTTGWGVQRSTDYGKTWTHVGSNTNETVVVGTSKNIYSMFGWSIGPGQTDDPVLQIAAQPGTGSWAMPGTPAGMPQGPHYISVTNDGTHNVLVGAMGNGGVWRYVEP